ncbi:MAG: hypothetical protein R3F49_23110 [Planctomycetota bacterium]
MRLSTLPFWALALVVTANAQVMRYVGPSPNLTTALDFDSPPAPVGPIASNSPVFTSAGVSSITLVGTWLVGTDTLTNGSNVNGLCLVSQGGNSLTVDGAGAALDNPQAGAGFDIVLASAVDEFQCIFADQVNHNYTIELFNGATSLGAGTFTYANAAFPAPPHFWRSTGPFDRVLLTFPATVVGVGIDELAFGNGPPPVPPANDTCATPQPIGIGSVSFDSNFATTTTPAFTCAVGGADLWYSYTALTNEDVLVSTCGSGFDTVLEVYTGTCNALTSVACDDDACGGTQSRVTLSGVVAGTTYLIRVGGFNSAAGAGTLDVREVDPVSPSCAVTTFNGGNLGNVGGNVYFDMVLTQNASLSGIQANFTAAVGTPVGLTFYVTPTTYVGNELNQAAWTPVANDNGNALAQGWYYPTSVTFAAPLILPAGTYGVCLQASGSAWGYTNGNGANQSAMDANGVISLVLGAAQNTPFASAPFTPRVFNGAICGDQSGVGTAYCSPAIPNSTLASGEISGSGSAVRADNDLTLEARSLPNNSFGFFLTSRTQGMVANPGGSQGNLCLSGAIGRYVGAGQIKNSGAVGQFSLLLDLAQTPTPTGLVSIAVGETWHFQAWYRDAINGMATSNFTNGLQVLFQ